MVSSGREVALPLVRLPSMPIVWTLSCHKWIIALVHIDNNILTASFEHKDPTEKQKAVVDGNQSVIRLKGINVWNIIRIYFCVQYVCIYTVRTRLRGTSR